MDNFKDSRRNDDLLPQDGDAKTICLLENDPIEEIFCAEPWGLFVRGI